MTTIRPPHPGTATNFLVKAGFPKYTGPAAGSGFRNRSSTPEGSRESGGLVTVRWISTAPVPEQADVETDRMLSALHVALVDYGYAVRRSVDSSNGRPRPALVLIDGQNAKARDLAAPPAPVSLLDTSAHPVTYTVRVQRVLGKDWQQTAAGLASREVETAIASARRQDHPVFQLLDGTVRIGKSAYVPVPAAPVELRPDRRGEFTAPGGLDGWWVHEVSDDHGHTWQRLENPLLLRENPTKKLFAAAADFGRALVYDPAAGHATGAVMDNEPLIDRFTRLESYLPGAEQAPSWQLITADDDPSTVVAMTVRLLVEDTYAASGSWAKLFADGELQLHRPDRCDIRLRPLAADLSA